MNLDLVQQALKVAKHELVTMNGLVAADGEAPQETFEVDTCEAVRLIDEALTEFPDTGNGLS